MVKNISRPRSRSGSGQKPSTATQHSTKSSTEAMMSSGEGVDQHGARQPTQPQLPHSAQTPEHVRATEKSERDVQYADYVNQSRIQAMLDASKKALPVSPQSTSSPAAEESFTLPGPIVQFSGDEHESEDRGVHTQQNMGGGERQGSGRGGGRGGE